MRSRKAVSGDLDLAGCAYGSNDPDGHRYDDAKQALVTLDKAITALREALAEQPERELDKSSVCEDIQQLCMNGDLPWQFEDLIDWISKGEIPAQPQQEPVRGWWAHTSPVTGITDVQDWQLTESDKASGWVEREIYTTPPQRKTLTRDQVKKLITATGYDTASPQERTDFINGIRHAEAAHGIKENT